MRVIAAVFSVSIALYSLCDNVSEVASFTLSPTLPSFVFSVDPLLALPALSSPTWYRKWRERKQSRSFSLLGSKTASNNASCLKSKKVDEDSSAIKTKKQRNGYFDDIYRQRVEEFMEFYEQHGHGSVPCPYPPNPVRSIFQENFIIDFDILLYTLTSTKYISAVGCLGIQSTKATQNLEAIEEEKYSVYRLFNSSAPKGTP